MKKNYLILVLFILFSKNFFSQSHISTESHQDMITNIKTLINNNENAFYSSAEDGFIIKWTEDGQGEHYQISDVGIKMIAVSPNGKYVAAYESDGGSVNKVSIWDWNTLTRKYQKKLSDSVTSLAFSAKGTYLIIGTTTVDGAIFVKTETWQIVDKIKANTNIVNYINTSDSEKTCVFYSPAGTLSYYNMQNGQLKQKFNITQGLSQPLMFDSNRFLTGTKENQIYIINAYKGTIISTINANNPIILSNEKDSNLYYLEYDGRNTYELKMLENIDHNSVSNPRIVKVLKGPRGNNSICTGTKLYGNIILGNRKGTLFKTEVDASITTESLTEITENTYAKILDMAPAPTDFYFLTENSIFNSSYTTGIINKLASTNGQNKIISCNQNKVILWTKGSRNSVDLLDLDLNSTESLFTPKNTLQTLRLFTVNGTNYLIGIESNSIVKIYNMDSKEYKEVYSGTGIQDAVMANNGYVYIAKSAATNPKVPLLCVNIQTLETVPLNIKGNVSYGLSIQDNTIYGINLVFDENNIGSTFVFSYNIPTKQLTNILKFAQEDSEAFTYINGNNLYTNIGKNKVYVYDISAKKRIAFNRTASIPLSVCQKNNNVVILNTNGSISWCKPNSSQLIADWYLTNDEQWYEF